MKNKLSLIMEKTLWLWSVFVSFFTLLNLASKACTVEEDASGGRDVHPKRKISDTALKVPASVMEMHYSSKPSMGVLEFIIWSIVFYSVGIQCRWQCRKHLSNRCR